jgi:aryl-alcohol dehydrogenase-like predicted oxidoreductase
MGMSEFYGPSEEAASIGVLHHAIDIGVTFWDTADMYGTGHNERLVGRALEGRRDQVVLATKFAIQRGPDGNVSGVSGRPEYVTSACDASLQRLAVDHIDLYYQHRVDPEVPIEDTVGALADLVTAGKVLHLGLSEASATTLRRAASVHPITALQSELSLWSRDIEDEVMPACRELGIGLVAYSPLGRGFLTGAIRSLDDLAEDDWRRFMPRFEGDNFTKNLELVDRIEQLAADKGCTPAQLALAWVLAQGPDVVPIPGTRSRDRIDENAAATAVELTKEELADIDEIVPKDMAIGTRYPEAAMAFLDG